MARSQNLHLCRKISSDCTHQLEISDSSRASTPEKICLHQFFNLLLLLAGDLPLKRSLKGIYDLQSKDLPMLRRDFHVWNLYDYIFGPVNIPNTEERKISDNLCVRAGCGRKNISIDSIRCMCHPPNHTLISSPDLGTYTPVPMLLSPDPPPRISYHSSSLKP